MDLAYAECIHHFAMGIKECLIDEQERATLLSYFASDPYCADLTLSAHNLHSTQNLSNGRVFVSLLRPTLREVLV